VGARNRDYDYDYGRCRYGRSYYGTDREPYYRRYGSSYREPPYQGYGYGSYYDEPYRNLPIGRNSRETGMGVYDHQSQTSIACRPAAAAG
jgi:hypothetical protein